METPLEDLKKAELLKKAQEMRGRISEQREEIEMLLDERSDLRSEVLAFKARVSVLEGLVEDQFEEVPEKKDI